MTTELDFDAAYKVDGYPGIAWHIIDYAREFVTYEIEENVPGFMMPDIIELQEEVEDRSRVIAVMIGDDRSFTFDVEDLTIIDDDDYCSCCGQLGCPWG